MKNVQTAPERIIVIDIKLSRGLVVGLASVLVVAVLLGFLTLTGGNASASETATAQAASTGMRQFYLSSTPFDGNEVLGACAAGYHMASFWEIADPSNLKYNTDLGSKLSDSGQGPPATQGWVRTGYISGTDVTGRANCALWTSDSSGDSGSHAFFHSEWDGAHAELSVWSVGTTICSSERRVWCVED
jgi:hypothetical protein